MGKTECQIKSNAYLSTLIKQFEIQCNTSIKGHLPLEVTFQSLNLYMNEISLQWSLSPLSLPVGDLYGLWKYYFSFLFLLSGVFKEHI